MTLSRLGPLTPTNRPPGHVLRQYSEDDRLTQHGHPFLLVHSLIERTPHAAIKALPMTTFPLPAMPSSGGSDITPDPDSIPSSSDVLVVYQPVFRHHAYNNSRARSPSRSSPLMSPSPLPGVSEDSPHFMAVAPKHRHEYQDVPGQDDDEQQVSLLDPVRSRPIHALQSTGHEVADRLLTFHLQDRARAGKARYEGGSSHGLQAASTISTSPSSSKSSTSEHTVSIDCVSILPASYIRSNHHAFAQNHSTTISGATSPSGRSPHRNLFSNMRAHSPDRLRLSDSSRSLKDRAVHSRAGIIFADILHHSHPSSDSLFSAFNLSSPSHLLSSAPASPKADSAAASIRSASEQLLDLTDDLRIEDEAGEEAREQILDRLAVLAGDLQSTANEHNGYSVYVSTDVEQAHDGELLDDAIVRLAQAKAYREIVVVNDADWAPTIEATDAMMGTPQRALNVPQKPRENTDQLSPLPGSTTTGSPASPHGSTILLSAESSADHGFDFPSSGHGSSSSVSSTRRRSSHTSHEERPSTIGRRFGHHASGLTHALAHNVFHHHSHHDYHHHSPHHHPQAHHDHDHDHDHSHIHSHSHSHSHHHHGHHIHFPSLNLHGLHSNSSRASRTRERQEQAEVHRVLVTHTQHLARRLHDVKGSQVTLL